MIYVTICILITLFISEKRDSFHKYMEINTWNYKYNIYNIPAIRILEPSDRGPVQSEKRSLGYQVGELGSYGLPQSSLVIHHKRLNLG